MSSIQLLENELPTYINNIKLRYSENSKAYYFTSFIQKIFGINAEEVDLEIPVSSKIFKLRGRIDAVFGNLIIEFKKNLPGNEDIAEEELKKYCQAYKEKYPNVNYLGIANDGIFFKVYRPVFEDSKVAKLENIDNLDITKKSAEDVFLWFDSYLFSLAKISPSSKDLKKRFGLESPTYAVINQELKNLFDQVKDVNFVKIRKENWERFLEITYGEKPGELDLFFKHTYLSMFVKLLVHLILSKNFSISKEQISQIIYGDSFSKAGILNFIEEDFFMWILYPKLRTASIDILYKLLKELQVYDLDKIDEDILKELYQELIDPVQRRLLGEFYTPDWLAELIINDVLDNSELSVLDPACGSGTFLFQTIKYKIRELEKKNYDKRLILDHILKNVIGFDIHPLAVTISKTNYLLSIRELLRYRPGDISIPVYMSDSLKLPEKIEQTKMDDPNPKLKYEAGDNLFIFPLNIARDLREMDDIIEKLRNHAEAYKKSLDNVYQKDNKKFLQSSYNNILISFEKAISKISIPKDKEIIIDNLKLLLNLIKNDSDSIWTYILRNIYKPVVFNINKVDILIGNPPWIALQFMKNMKYQNYLKDKSKDYSLVDKVHNITHLELATLFFCQCADQYLKTNGKIGFVMPRSVLIASHHEKFRKFENPLIKLDLVYDLENVDPLFRIPSCAIIGIKGKETVYPVERIVVNGKLDSFNERLITAKSKLSFTNSNYIPHEKPLGQSFYFDKFSQGATLVPKCFWFVEIKYDEILGYNPSCPLVASEENRKAQKPWNMVKVEGCVEKEFLFTTIASKDIIPFGYIKRKLIVLPILNHNKKIEIVSSSSPELTTLELSNYLEIVEEKWKKYATDKSKSISIYEWINYRNKLVNQNPNSRYKVLYVASSTFMTSCVLHSTEPYIINLEEVEFDIIGFIAESTTYYFDTESEEEAHYLCAILNSRFLDQLIKPSQTKGKFGPRDIHKRPLSFPIPKFDPQSQEHIELSNLSKQSHEKVKKELSSINTTSIGVIRKKLRKILEENLLQIDVKVENLLS
jgi:hypothetical protein